MLNTKPKLKALLTGWAPGRTSRRRSPTTTQTETWLRSPGIAYLEAQEHIRDLSTRFLSREDIRRAIATHQAEGAAGRQEKPTRETGPGPEDSTSHPTPAPLRLTQQTMKPKKSDATQ